MVNFLQPEPMDVFTEEQFDPEPELSETTITDNLPAKRDPFDAGQLVSLFKDFHGQIDKMANQSTGLMVTDDKSLELAAVCTTQAKALAQAVEKKRVEVKAPYLEVVQVLDSETKGLKDRLAQIQEHLNGKITPYLQKKDAERREKERLAAVEAAKIQAELDKKAAAERRKAAEEANNAALAAGMSREEAGRQAEQAAAVVEDAPVVVASSVPDETAVKTETGSAKLKEEWTFTIEDIKAMPNEAFENRKAEVIKALSPWVNNQVKAGIRNIPGVKIFKAAKIQTRTSKTNFKF